MKMEEAFSEFKKEINFDSLVIKKDEFREKRFKTFEYCRWSKEIEIEEINFFKNASKLIYDKEFDKLLKKYLYLISLLSSIKELK